MSTLKGIHEEIIAPVSETNPRNSEASVVELKDGRLLLAWSDFYGGQSDYSPALVSGRLSADGGRTWGEKYTLQANTTPDGNTFSPALLRLRSGALVHFYLHQNYIDTIQCLRKSFDEGQTWTEEICFTPPGAVYFLANDRGVQTSTGRLVVPVTLGDEPTPGKELGCRSLCWFSDDEGETWQEGQGVISLPQDHAAEPAVIERRDGSLLMVIRTKLGDQYRGESFDGGDTWTKVRPMGLVSSEAPANIRRIPGTGDLLIVWNHVYDPYKRHFGRAPLTAAISRDDGETWENFRDLETDPDRSFAYPGILCRQDEVLLTYYRSKEQYRGWELKVKILPVEWFYL